VYDETIGLKTGSTVAFQLATGKAYKLRDRSFNPFAGTKPTPEKNNRFNIFNDTVQFPLYANDVDNAQIVDLLGQNERLVFMFEQEKLEANGKNKYQIYGLFTGMKNTASVFDIMGEVAWDLTLVDNNTNTPSLFLWDVSTTLTDFRKTVITTATEWDVLKDDYLLDDYVLSAGIYYKCIDATGNAGETPVDNSLVWEVVVFSV